MTAYVTLMRWWANPDGHTYIAGVASTEDSAIRKGTIEKSRRAGKYEFQVWHCKGNNKKLVMDSSIRAEANQTISPHGNLKAGHNLYTTTANLKSAEANQPAQGEGGEGE